MPEKCGATEISLLLYTSEVRWECAAVKGVVFKSSLSWDGVQASESFGLEKGIICQDLINCRSKK